jgi:hypothetical protein
MLLALTRGMIGALAGVITLAVLSALWGGLFGFHPSMPIYGSDPPGLSGAISMAAFHVIFLGPLVALAGFVAGVVHSVWDPPGGRDRDATL